MYKILYVDDESSLLEIGKTFLERDRTFAVDTSLSAVDALCHLKSVQYDAIVSDYQMPDMDGITFLKKIRSCGDTTPFIIFTGKGREEVVIDALNNGADFYLQKGGAPKAQFTELTHKIRHAIQIRKADLALKKSERDYRHLIESSNAGIIVTQDGFIRMVNQKAVELSGFSKQELLKQPGKRFIHPDDLDMVLDRHTSLMTGENMPSRQAFRFLHKNGSYRWIEFNLVPILWDERPAILTFVTDVTDRKQTEDTLRESEERYHLFFKTSLDAVFITTPDGRYLDFNDALMEHLGTTNREEVFSINAIDVYVHPEDRAVVLERVRREGIVREHPVQLRRLNGTIIDTLMTIVPQIKSDGSIKAYIGTVRDLSGRLDLPARSPLS